MPRGVLWLLVFGLAGADGFGATLGMTASTSIGAPMKIIVCQGSSCMGKCRGMFNPKDSFTEAMSAGEAGKGGEEIEIEEVQCMNMCKRGPNVRMVLRGELMTVDDKMNETEQKRKAFQGVSTEARAAAVFELAKGLADGSIAGTQHGPVPDDMM